MDLKNIELKSNLLPENISLNQVYSSGLEYAPVNEDNELLTAFVTCKDYFNDLIYSVANKKSVSIYGVVVDPDKKNFKLDYNNFRVAIRNKDMSFDELLMRVTNAVNFINDSFKKLEFLEVEVLASGTFGKQKCILVNMPKDFSIAPPLMSTFLLYLRAGLGYDKKEALSASPAEYVKNVSKIPKAVSRGMSDMSDLVHSRGLIENLEKDGIEKYFAQDYKLNYPNHLPVGTIHNNLGIRSYMTMYAKSKKLFHEVVK